MSVGRVTALFALSAVSQIFVYEYQRRDIRTGVMAAPTPTELGSGARAASAQLQGTPSNMLAQNELAQPELAHKEAVPLPLVVRTSITSLPVATRGGHIAV